MAKAEALNGVWKTGLGKPHLSSGQVHVWRAWLDQPAKDIEALSQILSGDERSRAARFIFERDRAHFIVGRGVLRCILARCLNTKPNRVSLRYGPLGKPELNKQPEREPLHFSVSHSNGIALYALAQSRRVGIDVEYIRALPNAYEIAQRFFSPREAAVLSRISEDLQQQAFFNCWTRKEAYLKALGEGLALPLDHFAVSLAADEPVQLHSIEGDSEGASHWSLRSLAAAPNYAAALAVEGHGWELLCWQFCDLSSSEAR